MTDKTTQDAPAETAAPAPDSPPADHHSLQPLPELRRIPVDAVFTEGFARDRGVMDRTALDELRDSIFVDGLRQPIEVVQAADEDDNPTDQYILLSGARRLAAWKELRADWPPKGAWEVIPALIRPGIKAGSAARLVAEENAVRAGLSPWEEGAYCLTLWQSGEAESLDGAVLLAYPHLSRQRRFRIRMAAMVVEELDGVLLAPHTLSIRRLDTLSALLRAGLGDHLRLLFKTVRPEGPAAQWRLIESVLFEEEEERRAPEPSDPRPGRPRRIVQFQPELTVRRERRQDGGWSLHFHGRQSTGIIMEDVMDYVEKWFGKI